jgi:serine/threonine protein kinase
MIGRESFAKVSKARHIPTKSVVAVKTIRKSKLESAKITESFF